jgi:hypothetical protein
MRDPRYSQVTRSGQPNPQHDPQFRAQVDDAIEKVLREPDDGGDDDDV